MWHFDFAYSIIRPQEDPPLESAIWKHLTLVFILNEQLHWKEHTHSICNKVKRRLGLIERIRTCLSLKAAKCVCNTLIEQILLYRHCMGWTVSHLQQNPSTVTESCCPHHFEAWLLQRHFLCFRAGLVANETEKTQTCFSLQMRK